MVSNDVWTGHQPDPKGDAGSFEGQGLEVVYCQQKIQGDHLAATPKPRAKKIGLEALRCGD